MNGDSATGCSIPLWRLWRQNSRKPFHANVHQPNMSASWLCLIIAGCFEVAWALGIKYTDGFSRPVPSVMTVGAMIVSVWLLAIALKSIPVGTGYAVWVGIGAVGAAIGGVVLFGESRSLPRVVCILLIVAGVLGLKLFSEHDIA